MALFCLEALSGPKICHPLLILGQVITSHRAAHLCVFITRMPHSLQTSQREVSSRNNEKEEKRQSQQNYEMNVSNVSNPLLRRSLEPSPRKPPHSSTHTLAGTLSYLAECGLEVRLGHRGLLQRCLVRQQLAPHHVHRAAAHPVSSS